MRNMTVEEIRAQIKRIQNLIDDYDSYSFDRILGDYRVTPKFMNAVSLLFSKYGSFVGEVKAKYPEYLEEIEKIDKLIGSYFEYLTRSSKRDYSFKLVTLAIGKISELISLIETIETHPPKEKVSKAAYERLIKKMKPIREQ